MIAKLKNYYGDNLIENTFPEDYDDYHWFYDNDNNLFGIKKISINKSELDLLNIFCNNALLSSENSSITEIVWTKFLKFGSLPNLNYENIKYVRFIQFNSQKLISQKNSFKLAIKGILNNKFFLVWNTETQGTIIELLKNNNDEYIIEKDSFETLISDFLVNINFFIGRILEVNSSLHKNFKIQNDEFLFYIKRNKKPFVIYEEEILPIYILNYADKSLLNYFCNNLLGNVLNDNELLHTVKLYIECNLNISLASKQGYVHRNTILYRVNKFISKTGINIKEFKNAYIVYLAIIINE